MPTNAASSCATRALCPLLTVDSKDSTYPGAITEQASATTPQNVSVKPQILAVYNGYLESNFSYSQNKSQRMLLRYTEY
jgi:hypothetical protein